MYESDNMARLLERLRRIDTAARSDMGMLPEAGLGEEFSRSGVAFVSSNERFEDVYYSAVGKLAACIKPSAGGRPVLHEGGIYMGTWLESTGTINAEILSRFLPSVAESTFRLFADFQRGDGLMPYKVTDQGPSYRQIQMVTPLARSAWNHAGLNGADAEFLETMYAAIERHDDWLYRYRNTRGTGCIEAFGTFDTGHDLSPRFWHVADTPHLNDAARCNPDSPILPFLAPDLTANVYCQRKYMQRMADKLGRPGADWDRRAEETLRSLMRHCYDERDAFFYDVDKAGRFVRVQSDVLLRVLACEAVDDAMFADALTNYLLNACKFFAKYPFTSIALDDPRFDPSSAYNTWAGATNFLSLIRAPHAFEHHRRFVELTWVLLPILSAMARMTRFGQVLSPWTGEEGFTETYSPAILCLLDYVERLCGILPRPDGAVWFTGLVPYAMDHGESPGEETAYARRIGDAVYELANTRDTCAVYRDGRLHCRFPFGLRIVTDRQGALTAVIGMSVREIRGSLWYRGSEHAVAVAGNETAVFTGSGFRSAERPGIVLPTYR